MKRLNLIVGLSFCLFGMASAQSDYYWANGKKVSLEKKDKEFVLFEKDKAKTSLTNIRSKGSNVHQVGIEDAHGYLNKTKGSSYEPHAYAVLDKLKETAKGKSTSDGVVYKGPVFKNDDGSDLIMTNFFYVRLKNKSDFKVLKTVSLKQKATILGSNSTDESWYLLSSIGSGKNAVELANIFYETGLFESAEPEMLIQFNESCYNDNMFTDQWGANNTGQTGGTSGIDINLCEAHAISKGSGIIVSVLDEGVQYGHPDLPNVTSLRVYASNSAADGINGDHGMQCAGIIGAQENNGIGMVGVAPDCEIMPSSIVLNGGITSTWPWGIAAVINLTWQNGADIISNSWSGTTLFSSVISSALNNALNDGRNGLGTVIVFAAGNDNNGAVSFPGNSDDRILVVGALSPCGERKNPASCDGENWWGSNFGTGLDVMAPGVQIPTITLNGAYSPTFNGTSSATPHVAGVAALILSANPNLTVLEVNDIIENTARKIGGYSYQTNSARPNGTWNNEMGYGLLDAEAAVLAAVPTPPLFTTFSVPRSSAIPQGFRQFSHVYTIGSGGPSLSHVHNSVFNWWGNSNNPNGLYQFTLETNGNNPRYYTNIPDYGSYSLHGANPEFTINSNIGFSGLAGSYWVNVIGSDLVLVSKTGDYALYFTNSSTVPPVKMGDFETASSTHASSLNIAPNPFTESATIYAGENSEQTTVTVFNSLGILVEEFNTSGGVINIGKDYNPGMYIIHMSSVSGTTKQTLIKQ